MTWTSPKTWVVSDVLTASDMNTYVRDNTSDLNTRLTPLESGLAVIGSGTGTATSVSMTEPSGERLFKIFAIIENGSGTNQITLKLNALTTNYNGQYWNIASDAVQATPSLDYTSAGSWALTANATINLSIIEAIVAIHVTSSTATFSARYWDGGTNTNQWFSSGYRGTATSIDTIILTWGVSADYRYVISAMDF